MNLPELFIQRTQSLLKDEFSLLQEALNDSPIVSLRINPAKRELTQNYAPVLWSQSGYYLPERLTFTFDPLFHAGAYYVQEASSMFLEHIMRTLIDQPVTALDLCAAPGGKSTNILSVLPRGSLLVSNEVIRQRARILNENVTKWGAANAIVTQNDPKEIGQIKHGFDLVVADVPCSGEGMFRKDPESIQEWSLENVELCAARQQRIVSDVWSALKPGGYFIYSTCTYNLEENEHNLQYIIEELGAEPIQVDIPEEWKITGALTGNYPAYRFFPHKTKGEGFFIAVVRKLDQAEETVPRSSKKKSSIPKSGQPIRVPEEAKKLLLKNDDYRFTMHSDGTIQALPHQADTFLNNHKQALHILSAGVRVGQYKGKNLIPDSTLAFSESIDKEQFVTHELGLEQAIRFLQKEALTLPSDIPNGFVLLTFKQTPIGFVKQIGNRANNLFPAEWKIKTKHLPENILIANI